MKKQRKIAALSALAAFVSGTLSGCPEKFDPSQNAPATVYGPPEWFENGGADFDPGQNELPDVYGPPEWFDGKSELDPEENIEPTVYGPPEMFEIMGEGGEDAALAEAEEPVTENAETADEQAETDDHAE